MVMEHLAVPAALVEQAAMELPVEQEIQVVQVVPAHLVVLVELAAMAV